MQNNPVKFVDPTGRELSFIGRDADYIVSELERFTGIKLKRDPRTGKVTIDTTVKRNMKGTSTWFANKVIQVIGDPRANVKINTGRSQAGIFFDSYALSELDVDDYDAIKKADSKFAAESLAHVIEEYYYEQIIPITNIDVMGLAVPAGGSRGPLNREGRFDESHLAASDFESKVLSDFTGWWEKPFQEKRPVTTSAGQVATFEFSSVIYDVTVKNANVVSISKYEKQKPKN